VHSGFPAQQTVPSAPHCRHTPPTQVVPPPVQVLPAQHASPAAPQPMPSPAPPSCRLVERSEIADMSVDGVFCELFSPQPEISARSDNP
jgi:hypothetical protein